MCTSHPQGSTIQTNCVADSYHNKEHTPENHEEREKREVGVSVDSHSMRTQGINGQANPQGNTNELEIETLPGKVESNFFA